MQFRFAAIAAVPIAMLVCGGCAMSGAANHHRYRLTLITSSQASRFDDGWVCGAKRAARRLGVDLLVREPRRRDPATQIRIVEQVAERKPDAVVIAPARPRALLVPLQRLAAAGSKVVAVGTRLGPGSPAVSEIGSDYEAGGRAAALAVDPLTLAAASPRERRTHHYLGRMGMIGGGRSPARSAHLVEGFVSAHGSIDTRIRYFGVHLVGDDIYTITRIALELMPGTIPLRFVLATDSRLAEDVGTGMIGAGAGTGPRVLTWGADHRNIANLRRGIVDVLFVEHARQIGASAIAQAVAALRGRHTRARIATGWSMVTHDRLGEPRAEQALAQTAGC
ncbi:MAG: substrate-binding domain-containing protein [Dehalococcoidia bacterium]